MYGFAADYRSVIDVAERLQQHFDELCERFDIRDIDDFPQVSVSFAEYAAIVEVDGIQVWSSEEGVDLTLQSLLDAFTKHCAHLARFAASPTK